MGARLRVTFGVRGGLVTTEQTCISYGCVHVDQVGYVSRPMHSCNLPSCRRGINIVGALST